jgi:hypothetical protein
VLLTVERGWSATRYDRWLADAWHRLLLPSGDGASLSIIGNLFKIHLESLRV